MQLCKKCPTVLQLLACDDRAMDFCSCWAFPCAAETARLPPVQADYLEQTNAILCRKLEKVQGHGTELEEYLAQLNTNILAKERRER